MQVYVYEAAARIMKSASDAVSSFASPDEIKSMLNCLSKLTTVYPVNIKDARRRIAAKLIEDNRYSY